MQTFDESRDEFKPYGFSCVWWSPSLMRKPDRHNEIEINFLPKGSVTYLVNGQQITIPAERLAIFWGLIPHQIVQFEAASPYFVCTIPFSQFLSWQLPKQFVQRVIQGEIILDADQGSSGYDRHLFETWLKDFQLKREMKAAKMEMKARLTRMAIHHTTPKTQPPVAFPPSSSDHVIQMAAFIAQHYQGPIKASDVGKKVGLHPDYANALFRKTFGYTLRDYILEERVSHAQRKLLTSDESITAIAYDSGFQSISRFNAAFRKISGCTPRTFRQRQLWRNS